MFKLSKYLRNPDYRFLINSKFGIYDGMDDADFLRRKFKARMGYELNLENPATLNEKLNWLKLYDRNPLYTTLVDKALVKDYVAPIIGQQHIIPTLGVWDRFDEIPFDALPQRFVLKCTHDSGGLVVCRDKAALNLRSARKKIEGALKHNYYLVGREWPYKDVRPRILAEQYMENTDAAGRPCGLIDYKFFCFNNEPRLLYISQGLENHATASISFYDLEGRELPYRRSDYKPIGPVTLPDNFPQMRAMAGTLAEKVDSPFVRIDLYSIKGEVYFSEITFSPCSGLIPFEPAEWDAKLGELLELPR